MDTFESLSHSVWECKYHAVLGDAGPLRGADSDPWRSIGQFREERLSTRLHCDRVESHAACEQYV